MAIFGLINIELLDGRWDWRSGNRSHSVLRIAVDPADLDPHDLQP
ncbi:MAG: hypothetical protein V2I57_06350 [Xanthomonadales bacterium]|jgi:hypothetical protein|nr:hypothetical protein [Xanthomonadales bacterium]